MSSVTIGRSPRGPIWTVAPSWHGRSARTRGDSAACARTCAGPRAPNTGRPPLGTGVCAAASDAGAAAAVGHPAAGHVGVVFEDESEAFFGFVVVSAEDAGVVW